MTAIITNILRAPSAKAGRLTSVRTIHLVDIENLCGESRPSKTQVEDARERYLGAVACYTGDHFVVASSTGNFLASSDGWPGARYLVRDGKDGADLCLMDVMVTEGLADRFDRVVVASGDGGLAPSVAQLAEAGMATVVVSQSERLSRKMRMAAHKCILLTPELEDIA